MKFVVLCATLLINGGALAAADASSLKFVNGKIIVAQSYCEMCRDANTACVLQCNGSGACIQNCSNQYRDCVDQNCRARVR